MKVQIPLANYSTEQLRVLFGQCDENLKTIRQKTGIKIHTNSDTIFLEGPSPAIDQIQKLFAYLFEMLRHDPQSLTTSFLKTVIIRMQNSLNSETSLERLSEYKSKSLIKTTRRTIHGRTPAQNAYIDALHNYDMVFALGPAGTGKTYLAVAFAVNLLEKGLVKRVILSRPAVEAGERLGFLPGDMKEKVDPYLRPLYDALYDMLPPEKIEYFLVNQTIEIAPLAFMRGRTLAQSAVILDEAQNTTPMQMKMFLTRFGEESRMIITGDTSQIDLPRGQNSGLCQALEILRPIPSIKFIHFAQRDIMRHPLVQEIIDAYNRNVT